MIGAGSHLVPFVGILAVIVREMGNGVVRVDKPVVLDSGDEIPTGFEPIDLPLPPLIAECLNASLEALGYLPAVITSGWARPICALSFELMVW